jgi:hypothetical protein
VRLTIVEFEQRRGNRKDKSGNQDVRVTSATFQVKFTTNNKYPSTIQSEGQAAGIAVSSLVRLLQSATARQYLLKVYKAPARRAKLSARAIANSLCIPG